MDKAEVVEHVRRYAEAVRKDMEVEKIVLFGSHARGTARLDSDIDVAIVVNQLTGDWMTLAARLHRLTRDIDINIEPVLLDASKDPSGFIGHVMETGEVIYTR